MQAGIAAEVARRDPPRRIVGSSSEELCAAADLDPAARRRVLADHDAGPRISPQMGRASLPTDSLR